MLYDLFSTNPNETKELNIGSKKKDGKVICKLCEVAMNIATIGFKGGCNPIPIDYKVSNGTLTVPISALEASASIFAK